MADYPISNVPRRIVYTGSAGVGPYAFPFEVLLNTDINVYKNDVLLALTGDYIVTISPTLGTGTVTLVVAATGTDRITIVGARAVQRTTDFTTGGDFFANTVNSELDSQTILTQQVAETAERSIKAPVTDPTNINMTLPNSAIRANKKLGFDALGNISVDDFNERYLGAKASNPTVDNNGQPLTIGALYFNTTVNQMRAFSSTGWTSTSPATASDLVDFIQSGSGAVSTTVEDKLREVISVKDFGAVGDGVANDTAAIQAAITEAATTGKILYVNAGTYLIFSSIGVTLTSANKDLHINCDPSAVLKAASTFPVDTKFINILASSGLHNVAWFGGKIDGRLMPTKVAVAAPDALTINGGEAYIQKVLISNLNIILNDTRSGTAGDSCLFVAGCDDVSIVNNIFQGAVDLGVYISGQASTFVGERIYVAGNTFIECGNGVGSKRDYKSHIIDGNFFKDCGACVFIGGEVGADETAKKAVISNNALQRCARGIEARICDGTVISGNRIEDYGINFGGAAVADAAILVSGSNNCVVSSNVMLFTGAYVPNAGAVGVRINARVTPTPTTFTSQYNLITGNNFKAPSNVNFAVQEVSGSGSNYNNILNNIVEGFNINPPYSIVGANSNIGQVVTLLGADPILTIQDTETSIPSSIARLRLGESSAGGVLDNFLQIAYDGSSVGATFAFNATNVMQLNRTTFAVNLNPRTTLSDATGNAGDVYYDSSTNKLRCHNGTIWNDLF